jgi:hypothetical protein
MSRNMKCRGYLVRDTMSGDISAGIPSPRIGRSVPKLREGGVGLFNILNKGNSSGSFIR